jgi:hypothetical protein
MTTSDQQRRFTDWLAEHRNGLADADLADALRDLAEACARTGKNGTLTLTLKVSPKGDMLAIADTLGVKLPTEVEERLYWVDLAGNLTRNHPLQPTLTTPDGGDPGVVRFQNGHPPTPIDAPDSTG